MAWLQDIIEEFKKLNGPSKAAVIGAAGGLGIVGYSIYQRSKTGTGSSPLANGGPATNASPFGVVTGSASPPPSTRNPVAAVANSVSGVIAKGIAKVTPPATPTGAATSTFAGQGKSPTTPGKWHPIELANPINTTGRGTGRKIIS